MPAACTRTSATAFSPKPSPSEPMSAKVPTLDVLHIKESCERIVRYAAEAGVDWPFGSMAMDAICRNLQIIGGAARRLDSQFREAHPEVPWKSAIGLRNVITHAYDTVIPEVIREIVKRDIPPLLEAVRRILGEEAQD